MASAAGFVIDLVSTDFPKVAGFFGFVFLILGVAPKKVVLGPVIIPSRDTAGRIASIVLGFLLVCVPLVQLSSGVILQLYGPPLQSTITQTNSQRSTIQLIGPAYAANGSYRVTASQRSRTDVSSIFSRSVGLYVGDIHLTDPNTIMLFDASAAGAGNIKPGVRIAEAQLRSLLPSKDVFFIGSLKQGQVQNFSVGGQQYTIGVETIAWSLIGNDSVTLSIKPKSS